MLSSLECLAKAAQCESLAGTSLETSSREAWLTLAAHWRMLADQASKFGKTLKPTGPHADRGPIAARDSQNDRAQMSAGSAAFPPPVVHPRPKG